MAQETAWSQCESLDFLLVRPLGSTVISQVCNPSLDKNKCIEYDILAKFGRTPLQGGEEGWTISLDEMDARKQTILGKLQHSPIIKHMNELKIVARKISQKTAVCEPNLIYLGQKKLVGLGPVFFDGLEFVLEEKGESKIFNNLMAIEDAQSPEEFKHIPLVPENLLSLDSLEKSGYLMLAVAHEMGHGLMQDLYGIEGMKKVLSHHHSRSGHFASAVTDPALAWVEGFAEGFEAYLGEKFSHPTLTPTLDRYFFQALERNALQAENPAAFWWSLLPAAWDNLHAFQDISSLMSDFLTDERQVGIAANNFVLKGNFINLYQKYDIVPVNAEYENINNHALESTETILSKEGAVAHLIYVMLKKQMAPELFSIVSTHQPLNVQQFVNLLQEELTPEKYQALCPTLNAIFTPQGRQLVANYQIDRAARKKAAITQDLYTFLGKPLVFIDTPVRIAPSRELWVEFLNDNILHVVSSGRLDRINLAVATPEKLLHLTSSLTDNKEMAQAVLVTLKNMQNERPLTDNAVQWGKAVVEESQRLGQLGSFEEARAHLSVGLAILDGHSCFLARHDSQKADCWSEEPVVTISSYFANRLYDYVQSGKAREDFFYQTDFGNLIMDMYVEYLHETVSDQKNRTDSPFNRVAQKLLQAKEYVQDSLRHSRVKDFLPVIPVPKEVQNLLKERLQGELTPWQEQRRLLSLYWSTPEKREEMRQYVLDHVPWGHSLDYYSRDPELRGEIKEGIYKYVPGIETTFTYWSSGEKREEMKNYVSEQYFKSAKMARTVQKTILNVIPGGRTANEYWSQSKKRTEIYQFVQEEVANSYQWLQERYQDLTQFWSADSR